MNLSGVLLALLTTLSWSICIFPFTEAAKRLGVITLNLYRLLLAWVIVSILLMLITGMSFIDLFIIPLPENFIWFGLSGIIGFSLGDYFGFSSFTKLGPKLASVYTTLAPGVALFFAYFILNERINVFGVIGIAFTIFGVIWLTLSKNDKVSAQERGFVRDKKGILFAVLSAVCQGLGLVLSKYAMSFKSSNFELHALHANWMRLMIAFAAAFLFSAFANKLPQVSKPIFTNQNKGLKYLFWGTLFGPVLGVSLCMYTINIIPVAEAQTIFALLPVIILPMNLFFYKEKITITSIIACLISILGVAILIWRNIIFDLIFVV